MCPPSLNGRGQGLAGYTQRADRKVSKKKPRRRAVRGLVIRCAALTYAGASDWRVLCRVVCRYDHDRSRRRLPTLRPGRTRRAVRVPSTAVGWLSTSMLAGETRRPPPHSQHDRLRLGVCVLPHIYESAVVIKTPC